MCKSLKNDRKVNAEREFVLERKDKIKVDDKVESG